jgi:GT2 family glycosyltransferase
MNNLQSPTVLIVTYERLEATRRCIEAVLECGPHPLKLILVDNGSREEVQNCLMKQPGIKIFLGQNLGLYRALNLGMKIINDDLVAFLDCDIVVRPGWWEALTGEVASDPQIGLAGSRYLNPDGSLQEGYPILSPNGWYGSNLQDRNVAADCQYIAIGCSVFRRSAWEAVGGFDESYFISHGDIDFCYKLRYEVNLRIRYCPESSVIHDHDFKKEAEYETARFNPQTCNADYVLFKRKWEQFYRLERECLG